MLASILIASTGGGRLEDIARIYLHQALTDIEVVLVVDNPSVDRGAFLAPLRFDKRLKLAFNEANIGLTRSLNRGLEMCRGDVVLRNDDDDMPHHERVAKTTAFLERRPECDLVYSFARGIDEVSGRSWTISGPSSDAEIKAGLLKRNFIAHSSLAIRTNRLKALGGYDATFRYAQDYDLYLRSIRAGLVFGCIPEVLVERYYGAQSITVKRRRTQILYSFAARLIHDAETSDERRLGRTMLGYLTLLAIPNSVRALRRRLGRGR